MTPPRATYRIALVAAGEFPSPRGSQALMAGIGAALVGRGHELHAVAHGDSSCRGAVPAGVTLHRPPRLPRAASRVGWIATRIVEAVLLTIVLLRVVRRRRIEIVDAHNYEGLLVALVVRALSGVSVVYHAHNVLSDELPCYVANKRVRWVAKHLGAWLDGWAPKRADLTIALTAEVAGYLSRRGARSAVIEPVFCEPVDARVANPPIAVPAGVPAESFTVAYAGNLDSYQDLDVLAAGFEMFRETQPGARLQVITHDAGEIGPSVPPTFQRLVRSGAASILISGDPATTQAYLHRANVLVCPRSSWSGYPMKLLNYFAAERPVVVARGSAKQVRDGENGLIFEDRDAASLARTLARLQADSVLRATLASGARKTLEELPDADRVGERLEAAYSELRAKGPSGRPGAPRTRLRVRLT